MLASPFSDNSNMRKVHGGPTWRMAGAETCLLINNEMNKLWPRFLKYAGLCEHLINQSVKIFILYLSLGKQAIVFL